MSVLPPKVVFFDGICKLCNGTVAFLIRNDRAGRLHFCSLQSETARKVIPGKVLDPAIDSIVYYEDGAWYVRSEAALRIIRQLPRFRWLYSLIVLPQWLRDGVYDLVATYRYQVFGRKKECMIPDEKIRERFL